MRSRWQLFVLTLALAAIITAQAPQSTGTIQGDLFDSTGGAAPGVKVPFVAAVVDCDGTSVRTNIINVEPDPEHVHTGMKVRLATYSMGTDDSGTEAIGFGYEPVG